jgi:hypothetical protein
MMLKSMENCLPCYCITVIRIMCGGNLVPSANTTNMRVTFHCTMSSLLQILSQQTMMVVFDCIVKYTGISLALPVSCRM